MSDSMMELIHKADLIPPGSSVLCAVSGGADSIYLLHRLWRVRQELHFTLSAAHFDHQLRGEESAQDMEFVQQFTALCCGREHILLPEGTDSFLPPVKLYTGSGDVAAYARALGLGLEEAAREMRYAFLRQTAQRVGAQYIATAHTANDNAETLFLHLARGSGLNGLGGIAPKSGDLIRPLLTTTRDEIEAYLRYRGLPWREDLSNRDDSYSRNRLRHRVLPELDALYPGFVARLTDTAARLRADEALLSAQAAASLTHLQRRPDGSLALPAEEIAHLPQPLAVRAARLLLAEANDGDNKCTSVHLDELVALCRSAAPSGQLNLPGGLIAYREYQSLVLTRAQTVPLAPTPLPLPGQTRAGCWDIICTLEHYGGQPPGPWDFWLDCSRISSLTARPRKTGDRLQLKGRPRKPIKKWMIEAKIPRYLRDSLPILDCGRQVAAAAGLGPETAFLPELGAEAWHIRLVDSTLSEKTEKPPGFER